MKPRVIALIRWPVGGIRTWCRYVYSDPAFESMSLDLLMPRISEAETLQQDLCETKVRFRFVDHAGGSRHFMITAFKAIMAGKYSLVHSHGFTSGLAAFAPCGLKRIPHLVTPHDMILDEQFRDLKGRMGRKFLSLVLSEAAGVQAVSAASAENLRLAFPKAILSDDRLVTVQNGIESSRFLNAKRFDLKATLGIPPDGLSVGFFGRFMAPKGFKYIIESIKLNTQTNLTSHSNVYVVAVGGGGFRREEENVIRAAGLTDRFRFLEFSPNVADLIRSVDVVVMPSLWEACGLLAMEALVAGTPLVASDCQALADICNGTPAKVVARKDSVKLLEAIVEQGSEFAKAEAQGYRHKAAERFDVRRTSAKIVKIYEKLLAGSLQTGGN